MNCVCIDTINSHKIKSFPLTIQGKKSALHLPCKIYLTN